MTIDEMLLNQDTTKLVWYEPWPSLGADGHQKDAHITMTATVRHCIAMARAVWEANDHPWEGRERDLLLDFMAIHFAEEYK